MSTYDQFQQMYCLSAASNAVGSMTGTEADLQTAMDTALAEYIPQLTGAWKVTWGPRVFKSDPSDATTGPDNVWFVAVDDTQKLCVVAVAGTASYSETGWFIIDFDVENVVDFNAWTNSWASQGIQQAPIADPVDGTAYAAQGTCIGVYNVLSHPSNAAANGQLLGDYIANSIVPLNYSIVFTGHSMGGAVAPTVALGLVNTNKVPTAQTYILPSAGATPGNAELAQAITSAFPPSSTAPLNPYAVFNTDFFNTLDIVPQAWSTDPSSNRNMDNIIQIYSNARSLFKGLIEVLVALVKLVPESSQIAYEPLPGTSFTGPAIQRVDKLDELTDQILLQHTTAYWQEIGIVAWVDKFSKKLLAQPGVGKLGLSLRAPSK